MNSCADCVWFHVPPGVADVGSFPIWFCTNRSVVRTVNLCAMAYRAEQDYIDCGTARGSSLLCGYNARYFEQRPIAPPARKVKRELWIVRLWKGLFR